MATEGLSTLGIKLYAAEAADGEKVTTPASYTQMTRINAIGEVTVEPENIDASSLEDLESKFVPGRGGVTDTLAITINVTSETVQEWEKIKSKKMCFMVVVPGLEQAFFTIATVPSKIPQPPFDQNALLTAAINCTVNNYIGLDDAVSVGE